MLNFKAKSALDDDYNSNTIKNIVISSDKYSLLNNTTKKALLKSDCNKDAYCVNRKLESNKTITKFAVKKKSPTDNCCFSMTRRRCRSVSPPPPPIFTEISTISNNFAPSAKIQTLRLESSIKCKKLLRCNGYPNKVILYPEESWARSAASSYWTLSPTWWNCSRCKVVEVTGTKRFTAQAKMIETDSGNLYIVGSFKKCAEPDFKLVLTANITIADFNMGYCMTGSLERGSHKLNTYQTTHFAVIRRAEFNQ
ncbi:uncharacterized protein LOC135844415 [Planococcus citri]|uniref:uncharacterized protein LOC135844415 n=1 Tax=Planococcus citri TaxID=170843 RepID=UPI0031F9ADB3